MSWLRRLYGSLFFSPSFFSPSFLSPPVLSSPVLSSPVLSSPVLSSSVLSSSLRLALLSSLLEIYVQTLVFLFHRQQKACMTWTLSRMRQKLEALPSEMLPEVRARKRSVDCRKIGSSELFSGLTDVDATDSRPDTAYSIRSQGWTPRILSQRHQASNASRGSLSGWCGIRRAG